MPKIRKLSKSSLAIIFSQLEQFTNPDWRLEQFPTDSEIAADFLWNVALHGELEGKDVADLGSGTGLLGIGALLLGAASVTFVDIDKTALGCIPKNIDFAANAFGISIDPAQYTLTHSSIESLLRQDIGPADLVLENPPFGSKRMHEHIDRQFLLKACEIAPIIYSFHKSTSDSFIASFATENGYRATIENRYAFPLKKTQHYHTSRIKRVDVTLYRLEKESVSYK